MNNQSNALVRFVLMSATQLASNNGKGFWNDSDGWGDYQCAKKYTTEDLMTCTADIQAEPNCQWITLAPDIAAAAKGEIPYRIVLKAEEVDQVLTVYDCDAKDDDAAIARANAKYPNCDLYFVEPFNRAELSYVAYSAIEAHLNEGAGFWNNEDGWTGRELATRFSEYERQTFNLPVSPNGDAQWIVSDYLNVTIAATNTVVTPQKSSAPTIRYSVDGGETYNLAPEGVRLQYTDVPVPGEDENGEFYLNATHEGLIMDVYVSRESHLDHNIGTSSELLNDIAGRLVDANA